MQESAFFRMSKVLAAAIFLAAASCVYSLAVCGACPVGFFVGLTLALFAFSMTVTAGVVLYLE
jgi:hypothetical protein